MQRIITKITDSGVTIEAGPDANQTLQTIEWATRKSRRSDNWLERAIRNSACCEAKRSLSEREVRRLQWGI